MQPQRYINVALAQKQVENVKTYFHKLYNTYSFRYYSYNF